MILASSVIVHLEILINNRIVDGSRSIQELGLKRSARLITCTRTSLEFVRPVRSSTGFVVLYVGNIFYVSRLGNQFPIEFQCNAIAVARQWIKTPARFVIRFDKFAIATFS